MDRPVRWGVLGAAKIARQMLCPAINESRNGVLAALGTRDAAKARPFVERYPDLRVHDGYQSLLDDPEIEAVYIPLPNHLHVPWIKKALAAGKHVLCEKPIALSAAEIDDLIALRDASGLVVAEAVMVLHHPQWHRVKDLLEEGAIGQLRQIDGVFTYNNAADPQNVRNQPNMGGGGLLDIGIYPSVTARFVTGREPEAITARIEYEGSVDTVARVHAAFDDFDLDFYCSMRMALRQEMVFHGDKGWIRLNAPFNADTYDAPRLELVRQDRSELVERFVSDRQYTLQIEAFNAALRGGAPFPVTLEFSRGTQSIIDAAFAYQPT